MSEHLQAKRLPRRLSAVGVGALLLMPLGLSSCTGNESSPPTSSPETSTSPTTAFVPSSTLAGAPTNQGEEDAYKKWLKDLASMWSITAAPNVSVIRWVNPDDQTKLATECMQRDGWSQEDGSWRYPPAQESAFNLAIYTCYAQYPKQPKYQKPWTDKQTRILYDYMVKEEIPCLRAKGYTVQNVPSEEVFVANYSTSPFFPYAQVDAQTNFKTNAEQAELEQECPQFPSADKLY